MSLPKPDCLHVAVRHLADDRDVVVDPDATRADLRVARKARYTSRVQAEAASPYAVSLASVMASSSSSKGIAHSTGPKISSRMTSLSCPRPRSRSARSTTPPPGHHQERRRR